MPRLHVTVVLCYHPEQTPFLQSTALHPPPSTAFSYSAANPSTCAAGSKHPFTPFPCLYTLCQLENRGGGNQQPRWKSLLLLLLLLLQPLLESTMSYSHQPSNSKDVLPSGPLVLGSHVSCVHVWVCMYQSASSCNVLHRRPWKRQRIRQFRK